MTDIKNLIRSIPDFPKKGINFKDITTLLKDSNGISTALDLLAEAASGRNITKVVGIESRGFILGGALAVRLGCGFVPVRKPGKLPSQKVSESYLLEYGQDTIEMHIDAIQPGDRILLHDDLLATGGTAKAACNLIEKIGGEIAQVSFLIELSFLGGRKRLEKYDVRSLICYDTE